MASNSIFSFLLFLLLHSTLLEFPTARADIPETGHHKGLEVDMISIALSDKGYNAMSLTLEMTLKSLIPSEVIHNTPVTIFCPPDKAFSSSKYPQPPLTLLQYHVAQSKLDREALESSIPLGSKADTLLPGHPLVITTIPNTGRATINEITITEWDLYNDGRVIIHGVDDFFDPAFQTLRYPWFDDCVVKNDGENSSTGGSSYLDIKGSSKDEVILISFE